MYEVAICESEDTSLQDLRQLVKGILNELTVEYSITIFREADSLLKAIRKNPKKFHLLLLEIILKDENGIEVAKYLRAEGNEISILFTTHSRAFAVEGYSVAPIHYLIKPIKRAPLFAAIKKDYYSRFSPRYIILVINGSNKVLLVDSILYIETINRIIIVHTTDESVECSMLLKDISALLSEYTFVRCHKSFLVNIKHVGSISRKKIELYNRREIPVGRAFYNDALQEITSFLDAH